MREPSASLRQFCSVAKIGLAFIVEDDDLAVDHGVDGPCFESIVDGIVFFEGFVVAGSEGDLSFLQIGEGAIAVPFYFVGPAWVVEGFVDEGGEHGGEVFGDGFFWGGGGDGGG